jgi:hypothetical protein
MSSIRKRFDPELYRINDELAKSTVRKIIDKRKFKIEENSKKTGVDLLVYNKGQHVLNIETEIKKVWKGSNFKYDSVQIPERKKKFTGLEVPTLFVMFNEDQTDYLVIKDKTLLASPLVEVPNKYVYKGELFFQVPLADVVFNDINTVIKEVLNGK